MITRTTERPVPPPSVCCTVSLKTRGDHHFRLPDYGTALIVIDAYNACRDHDKDGRSTPRSTGLRLMIGAYAVGLCWAHGWADLAARVPWNVDPAEMQSVGASIMAELMEAGYRRREVDVLCNGVIVAISESLREEEEVQAIVDFTEAPTDGALSATLTSGSPSTATPTASSASTEASA